jgi:hypothetical protein
MRSMGAATQDELDSLRKRVRDLERAAGMTASGGRKATRKTGAQKASGRKKTTARKASKTTASRRKSSSAS